MDNSTKTITEINEILTCLSDYKYKYAVLWTMKYCKRKYNLRKPKVDVENVRLLLDKFTTLDILRCWDLFEKTPIFYEEEKKLFENNKNKLVSKKKNYRMITLCVLYNMFFGYIAKNNLIKNEIKTLDEVRTRKIVDTLYERVNYFIDTCGALISEAQNDTFPTESDKITTIKCFEKMKTKFEESKRLFEIDM